MTVLKLPRDDLGVLRLKQAKLTKTTAPASSLTATTGIGPQSSPISSASTSVPEAHRRGDRCQGRDHHSQNRQAAVLLDTRNHYEKRTHERRHDSTGQEIQHLPLSIDIHI